MELQIYNTLTRKKEKFVPINKDEVGMYSCGPTVYSAPSIGNLRATFTADLIRNTLQLLWYNVKAVMNITDVGHLVSDWDDGEDKMEKWARREWKSARDIAKEYEDVFKKNMQALNIDEFDVMPRATDHIKEQIELVQSLDNKWYTYQIDGDGIYMDTSKVEDYGKLMWPNYKKRIADLQAGQRVDMRGKKNATDFALWKFSPPQDCGEKRQMEWDSPWWKWFPGWHAECSAMSSKYLWHQFDIHHGGADHITIHHPNEIAQSECAFGVKPWVKYWIHNEFLQVDGGKMSKSLGNVYTLDDVVAKWYSPLDLRYFYFMAQYWNFQNFTWDQLDAARNSRLNLKKKIMGKINKEWLKLNEKILNLRSFDDVMNCGILEDIDKYKYFREGVYIALNDNINTPSILSIINMKGLESEQSISILGWLDKNFLKLWLFEEEKIYLDYDIPADIIELAEDRLKAKEQKKYALADELRNKIRDMGYEIRDIKEGYEITKI